MLRAACESARRTSGRDARRALAHLVRRHFHRRGQAVELPREARQRAVAAFAHGVDDRLHASVERAVAVARRRQKPGNRSRVARADDSEFHLPHLPLG